MEKKELLIINQFRRNARENLTKTARRTGIPVSTLFDKLKRYEGTIIKKHTALLDFSQIGFALKVFMAIKVASHARNQLHSFLNKHHRVNSLYKVTSGYDMVAEGIFRNLKEYQLFCEDLDAIGLIERQEFFVIEDIRQEEFLAHEEYLDILGDGI